MNCSSNPLGVHDCSHFEDAGVTCQSMLPCFFHGSVTVNTYICSVNTISVLALVTCVLS